MSKIRFAELTSYENFSLTHYVNPAAVYYVYQSQPKGPTTIVMQGSVKVKVIEPSHTVVEFLERAQASE